VGIASNGRAAAGDGQLGDRDPGGAQGAAHLARGLADAQGRAEVAREVDADGAHGP
jgi:hypothetical protein